MLAKPSETGFYNWIEDFKSKALQNNINKQLLDEAFEDIKLNKKIVTLDKKQPEKKITFSDYRKKVINNQRIKKARQKMQEYAPILKEIEKEFGVQRRFIVALWAIESNFGQNMGGFNIIEALANMAYEGRREEFFSKELLIALEILQAGHIKLADFKGSWAGAMGQCQFMPSSYQSFAYDYNGDGRKDIWGTEEDVFASIANYLKQSDWQEGYIWGRRVKLTKPIDDTYITNKKTMSLTEWSKLGVVKENGEKLADDDIQASLIDPDGDDGDKKELYLVYQNFKNIMKWNRSLYFATSVGLLSDSLAWY